MTWNEQKRILRADEGKRITDGETYAIEVKLPLSVNVESWREVSEWPEPENNVEPDKNE
jgi:hypothetical protein